MVSAAFQYIDKPHQIGIHVSLGIGQGIAHASLGGEIYHDLNRVVLENGI